MNKELELFEAAMIEAGMFKRWPTLSVEAIRHLKSYNELKELLVDFGNACIHSSESDINYSRQKLLNFTFQRHGGGNDLPTEDSKPSAGHEEAQSPQPKENT